jgi:hypothetical protein
MLTTTSEVKKEYEEKIEQIRADHKKKVQMYEDQLASKDEYIQHMLKVLESRDQTIKRLQKEKNTLKATIQIFEKDERRKKK